MAPPRAVKLSGAANHGEHYDPGQVSLTAPRPTGLDP